MDENGLSLITKSMVALPVSSRREIVNPARPGREQRQQWIRVPGSRRVWAAALFDFPNFSESYIKYTIPVLCNPSDHSKWSSELSPKKISTGRIKSK